MNHDSMIEVIAAREKDFMITEPTTEPNPTRQIAIPETSLPDVIEVTISEVDRQTAEQFKSTINCLICTALKNRGLNVRDACPYYAYMERSGNIYDFEPHATCRELCADLSAKEAPFYKPGVVGKTIKLRRRFS